MSADTADVIRAGATVLRETPPADATIALTDLADLLDRIAAEYDQARPCSADCPNAGVQVWSWPIAEALATRLTIDSAPQAVAG